MSDPTIVTDPLREEVAARKQAQGARAERARLGEIDRHLAEANQCPECGPAGASGGDASMHPGYVPVIASWSTGRPDRDGAAAWLNSFARSHC